MSKVGIRTTEPTYQRLDEGLILRSPRDDRDVERCAAFVSATVREISGTTTERILHHFLGQALQRHEVAAITAPDAPGIA